MTFKKGYWIRVEFDLELPEDCTKEQLREWLANHLAKVNGIDLNNPLHDYEPQADYDTLEFREL